MEYKIGVQDDWHAIDSEGIALGCEFHAWAACGAIVRKTKYGQPYHAGDYPVAYDTCWTCAWIVAARTETLHLQLDAIEDAIARDAAADILNAAGHDERDADDPETIQLLAAISAHAPVDLVAEGCSEGDCEHEGECPASQACAACSLIAGDWAGEWQGRYICMIEAPCAVLLRLAESAKAEVAKLTGTVTS